MTDANLTTLTIPSFSFPDIQVSGNRVERFGRHSFKLSASIATTDNADIVVCTSQIRGDFSQFYIVKVNAFVLRTLKVTLFYTH